MCHKGTLYLEKYLLTDFYSEFILESSYFDENQFINNKIEIYHWLKPENFGIEVSMQYIREVSPFCTLINKFVTPTEKLYCIIEISKKIYKFGNQKMGQDEFFPVFIFTFIHLKVKDLLYNLVYIKKYKSIQAKLCTNICTHVFLDNYKIIENDCECVTRISNATEKEMCFYLVNFEAMVNFIKRFEYKDLDIKKDVYDDNISNNLKNIDLSEYSSSKIKFKKDLIKGFKESFSKFIDYISKID